MSNITGSIVKASAFPKVVQSPYDTDRVAPPTPQEWSSITGQPMTADQKAIQVTTRIAPELAYCMDRIIEKKVYKLKSRHEFVRLAVRNLVTQCADELQQEYLQSLIFRMEQMHRTAIELELTTDVGKMIHATQIVVKQFLLMNNHFEAIRALRSAKRYAEELPHDHLKEKVVNYLYGSKDGKGRPPESEWDEAARLWHEVVTGESDRDDEDEVLERMKVL